MQEALRRVVDNSMKQYIRSRPAPSPDSVRRAKELQPPPVHPMFSEQGGRGEEGREGEGRERKGREREGEMRDLGIGEGRGAKWRESFKMVQGRGLRMMYVVSLDIGRGEIRMG